MAVDSETKRRSAAGMLIMALAIAPVPDGTIAAVDREHATAIYAGIAPGSPGLQTSSLHIFAASIVEPNHVSDSSQNVLLEGAIEAQGGAYFGGATNYTQIIAGNITQTGTGRTHESEKFKLTAIGGFAIRLTNKTGNNSVAGELVEAHQATADAVKLSAINSAITIGVFLDAGVSDASESWIVVAGIADVKYDAAGGSIGDWIKASGTVGRAASSGSEVPGANHFREIGHAIEGAAANALGRIVMHHN